MTSVGGFLRTEHQPLIKALLLLAAIFQPALALAAPPPEPSVSELVITASKMVSELTVTAALKCLEPEHSGRPAQRPRVVSTFPARGATVSPGLLVVRVTFDQPMACEGRFEKTGSLSNPCPGDVNQMLLSFDRRTVRTICLVEPGREYGFSIGQDPTSNTFVGLTGLPAAPARVAFSTSAAAPISGVCEALAEDLETAADLRRRGKLTCNAPHQP